MKTTKIELTDEELVILDGQVSEDAQAVVSAALAREAMKAKRGDLDPGVAGFVADAVTRARQTGKLVLRGDNLRKCDVCGRSAGYVKFKSGPRRGRDDHKRPRTFRGVDLAEAFFRVKGYAVLGACGECWSRAQEAVREELADVRAELPAGLAGPTRFIRHAKRKCSQCGWEGHEGQMRQLPAMMSGRYAGGCPECPAENKPFGRTVIEPVDGFEIVEVA